MKMMKIIKTEKKVKDHSHYTGKSRETAHSICNLRYKFSDYISIIIHNTSYDTRFIINQLAKEFKSELDSIGENMENTKHLACLSEKKTMKIIQSHTN